MKTCTKCNAAKTLDCFSKQARGRLGVTSICKACTSERGKEWHRLNKGRSAEGKRAYAEQNKDRLSSYRREWRDKNSDRLKALAAAWHESNRDKKRATVAARRARKARAIPAWADLAQIQRFYDLASRLTAETGIPANVDHLVPLQSPLVCGLHCAANLSVTTAVVNRRKGNLWWPQMWGRDEELDA